MKNKNKIVYSDEWVEESCILYDSCECIKNIGFSEDSEKPIGFSIKPK